MTRIERDSMGEIAVDAERQWGAQTQRSLENFPIGTETMPAELLRAFAELKFAAARANCTLGVLDGERCSAICDVCREILDGRLAGEFPLKVWQTGSGTQTNMNFNEVIAGRANRTSGRALLHPNDHVNRSQSSNDTFPTAMRVSAAETVHARLIPAVRSLAAAFGELENRYPKAVTVGRTHLMDAVPIRFSQYVSAWRVMLEKDCAALEREMPVLLELPLGGTAVGTGLNAPPGFGEAAAKELSDLTQIPFRSGENKFHGLTSLDGFVAVHGIMKALAADLMKIANDIRHLASGPRCGLGEITIPANEPGSSIMPGKVNPTQCEAVTMVAAQVMGNDVTVGIAASQGNFQLNVFLPVAAYNFLQSVRLLSDVMASFEARLVRGIVPNEARMRENLERSLMNVTALSPIIGYDRAAQTAKFAWERNCSLARAASELGFLTEEEAASALDPLKMV